MKRFLCVVAIAALLVLCAACSRTVLSDTPEATAAPTASSSRNVRSEPVTVTETYANSEVVTETTAAPAVTPETADTPETGDFPAAYFVGVLGLLLFSSAGLLMLRRI